MNLWKKLFSPTLSVHDVPSFWNWFTLNHHRLFLAVKKEKNLDKDFFNLLLPNLQALNEQFYCQAGMVDPDTAELIITVEGQIKSFVFAEELVAAAPALPHWKFTALAPPTGHSISIVMDGYSFNQEKISFTCEDDPLRPDEINLTLHYSDYSENHKALIYQGTMIYLENALGELSAATLIDNIDIAPLTEEVVQPIPIEKLTSFLTWKEKEFVEKYKEIGYETGEENYSVFESQDTKGLPLIAIIKRDLLSWDAKASHPWMLTVHIAYPNGVNGMPDRGTGEWMDQFEDQFTYSLSGKQACLYLGRRTYNNSRVIYFACADYRHTSKYTAALIKEIQSPYTITYDIFKDKYWRIMDPYAVSY
jgi:hypothetical protein